MIDGIKPSYKNTKCKGCHYEYTCMSITDENVRAKCNECKKPRFEKESHWGEMSYYREEALADRTWQERFSDETE